MIRDCTGVVLAGGASRRMGRDKAEIRFDGRSLLERTCAVLRGVFEEAICVGRADEVSRMAVRCVPDERPGMGPLGGLETALVETSTAWVFVVACDHLHVPDAPEEGYGAGEVHFDGSFSRPHHSLS